LPSEQFEVPYVVIVTGSSPRRMLAGLTEHAFLDDSASATLTWSTTSPTCWALHQHGRMYRIHDLQGRAAPRKWRTMMMEAETCLAKAVPPQGSLRHIGDYTLFWTERLSGGRQTAEELGAARIISSTTASREALVLYIASTFR